MCGRYTLSTPGERLAEVFDVPERLELEPRFNIAPTQTAPVIVAAEEKAKRTLRELRWGLIPFWAEEPSIGNRMINARAETVDEKPAYRDSFAARRCLVPADGFYEWRRSGRHKQPHFFSRGDGEPFAIAGIWARWSRGAEPIESYALITTEANATVAPIHDRMPVVLGEADWSLWLDHGTVDVALLKKMLRPAAADLLTEYPVSTYVNSPANDSSRCVEALTGDTLDEESTPASTHSQGRLF